MTKTIREKLIREKLKGLDFTSEAFWDEGQSSNWQEIYQYAKDENGKEYKVVWEYEKEEIDKVADLDDLGFALNRVTKIEEI